MVRIVESALALQNDSSLLRVSWLYKNDSSLLIPDPLACPIC